MAASLVYVKPSNLGKSLTMDVTTLILVTASCMMIADPDQRAYCRALESENAARCVEIRDYNLRQRCKLELGADPSNCNTISDQSQRALCQAKRRRS